MIEDIDGKNYLAGINTCPMQNPTCTQGEPKEDPHFLINTIIYFGTLDDKIILPLAFYVHGMNNKWSNIFESLNGAKKLGISFSILFLYFFDILKFNAKF